MPPPTLSGPVTLDMSPVPLKVLYNPPATVTWQWGAPVRATLSVSIDQAGVGVFVEWAAGLLYTVGGTTRVVPLRHPEYSALICKGIDTQSTGSYTPTNPSVASYNWSKSKVKLTFEAVNYAVDGSTPFVEIETRAGHEEYGLAGRKLFFSDGTPIQADAALSVPVRTYLITVHNCTTIDDAVVDNAAANPVSSATLFGKPAGQFMYREYSSYIATSTTGVSTYRRSIALDWRAVSWMMTLRPDGNWDQPFKGSPTGPPIYTASDLNALLN